MTPEAASALIALGGNVGEVGAAMQGALDRLHDQPGIRVVSVSPLYWTPPWGIFDQPRFLNCCAELLTELPPLSLLECTQGAERIAGRRRTRRWGPRTLDIDIVAYGSLDLSTPTLTVPHPRLFERAFVLVPLADIVPDRIIGGRRIGEAAADADRTGIERADIALRLPEAAAEHASVG